MNPFFSVVIPLYNKRPHILRSVYSVLGQEFKDFELIVVDDGSTDGSVDELLNINDKRLKIISKENGGASSARNRGIEESIGEYIAFLDADDEWEANYLELITHLIEQYPMAGLYATGYRNKALNQIVNEVSFRQENARSYIFENYFEIIKKTGASINNSSCSVIPISILKEVGLFPIGMKHFEDHAVWYKIALKYEVAYFSDDLVIIHKDAINRSTSNASALIKKDSVEKLFNELHKSISFDDALSHKQNALIKILNQRILSVLKQMVKEKELNEARNFSLKNNIDFFSKIIYASKANIITYNVYRFVKNLGLKK